jgi:predicted GIY-YIG superfamily endonuclease
LQRQRASGEESFEFSHLPGAAMFVQPCCRMNHQDAPRRCVYIIRSVKEPDRQYIGRTADVASRLASHNAGESPKTARQAPWQIVVLVQFVDERRALDFEKFLKSTSGRAFVKQYFG